MAFLGDTIRICKLVTLTNLPPCSTAEETRKITSQRMGRPEMRQHCLSLSTPTFPFSPILNIISIHLCPSGVPFSIGSSEILFSLSPHLHCVLWTHAHTPLCTDHSLDMEYCFPVPAFTELHRACRSLYQGHRHSPLSEGDEPVGSAHSLPSCYLRSPSAAWHLSYKGHLNPAHSLLNSAEHFCILYPGLFILQDDLNCCICTSRMSSPESDI